MNSLLKVDNTNFGCLRSLHKVLFAFLTLFIDVTLDDIDLKCNHRKLTMDGHIKPEKGAGAAKECERIEVSLSICFRGPFPVRTTENCTVLLIAINENEYFASL